MYTFSSSQYHAASTQISALSKISDPSWARFADRYLKLTARRSSEYHWKSKAQAEIRFWSPFPIKLLSCWCELMKFNEAVGMPLANSWRLLNDCEISYFYRIVFVTVCYVEAYLILCLSKRFFGQNYGGISFILHSNLRFRLGATWEKLTGSRERPMNRWLQVRDVAMSIAR